MLMILCLASLYLPCLACALEHRFASPYQGAA